MTQKYLKPVLAVAAMSMALAAPATAQIAKFHVMTPALPGLLKADRISSPEEALSEFLGSTDRMSEEKSASLGQMREAESIVSATGQELETSGDDGDFLDDRLGRNLDRGDSGNGVVPPPARPEMIAAADNAGNGLGVISRPDANRQSQVVIKTRTKGPRGGAKIKSGAVWSVGEFR